MIKSHIKIFWFWIFKVQRILAHSLEGPLPQKCAQNILRREKINTL